MPTKTKEEMAEEYAKANTSRIPSESDFLWNECCKTTAKIWLDGWQARGKADVEIADNLTGFELEINEDIRCAAIAIRDTIKALDKGEKDGVGK